MRFLYATALALALGGVAGAVPPAENYPKAPETFMKEVAESIGKLADAIKGFGTVHVETTFGLNTNALLAVGVVCFTLFACVNVYSKRGQ